MLIPEEQHKREVAYEKEAEAKGAFWPLRICPLKNGINFSGLSDENYCYKGCAWAINREQSKASHCIIYRLAHD